MATGPSVLRLQGTSDELDGLAPGDLALLQTASRTTATWTAIGSVAGVTLGLLAGRRIHTNRLRIFHAFQRSRAGAPSPFPSPDLAHQPQAIRFADGHEETIHLEHLLRPRWSGLVFTYLFTGFAGFALGGNCGALVGASRGASLLTAEPGRAARIQTAQRRAQATLLRRQADLFDPPTADRGEPSTGPAAGIYGDAFPPDDAPWSDDASPSASSSSL